jgi:hypothetical protein
MRLLPYDFLEGGVFMASLERRYDGRYRIVFCHQGKKFFHSLGQVSEREARSCKDRLEENLRFVELLTAE